MKKGFIFCYILFFTIAVFSQKTRINFKPNLNKKYEYFTQVYTKESYKNFNSTTSTNLTFYKNKNGYKVLQEYTNAEISERNNLIFFLNQKIDSFSNYRIYSLQKFLTRKDLFFHIDNNGNTLKNDYLNFFENSNLSRRDKKFLKEYTNNLNINTFNFFSNKVFETGKPFVINVSENNFLNKINSLNGQLISSINNKAIFKLETQFYTPIRNRKREIVDKKLNEIDIILTINKTDGMPLQMRIIFKNDDSSIMVSQYLKGEPNVDIKNFSHILRAKNDTQVINVPTYYKTLNKDSLNNEYKSSVFASKTSLENELKNLQPFKIETRRDCIKLSIDINKPSKKGTLIQLKKLRAYNTAKQLVFEQDLKSDFFLTNYKHELVIPIGYKLCKLPISYFEVDTKLSGSYGLKEKEVSKKNANENGILAWNANSIEMKNLNFFFFYNANNKQILPKEELNMNFFSSEIKKLIPFLQNKPEVKNRILFTGLIKDCKRIESYQLYFNEKVDHMKVFTYTDEIEINKTFTLSFK